MERLTSRDIVEAFDTDEGWEDREWVAASYYDNAHEYREKYRDALLECGEKRTGVEAKLDAAVSALLAIAQIDYRGNRSSESHMAHAALKDLGRWPE